MLVGTSTTNTTMERKPENADADECQHRESQRHNRVAAEERHRHFRCERQDQAGGGSRHAVQRVLHHGNLTVFEIERAESGHDQSRADKQPGGRGDRSQNAVKALADHHRHVDDVAARQELPEREDFGELLRRQPAALLNKHPPRPRQHAAKAHDRDAGEGDEEIARDSV